MERCNHTALRMPVVATALLAGRREENGSRSPKILVVV